MDTADAGVSDPKPFQIFDVPEGLILRPQNAEGEQFVFFPKEAYKCFTVSEYQVVANIVLDYRWFWGYALDLEAEIKLKAGEIKNLELQIGTWSHSLDVVQRGYDGMTSLFGAQQKQTLKMARSASLEIWAWRVGTIVAVVVAAGFGGAYIVETIK